MYRLNTLGGLKLEAGGTPLDDVVAHRKALALLVILAAQGGTSRDRLMALLWPDADEARARNSLKQAVHLIRRRLGSQDVILGVTELRLNPGLLESDVAAFTTALRAGEPGDAVAHYGGPFLDGVHVAGAGEFERWVEERRTQLARQYVDALEQLAAGAEESGDPVAAASWWRKAQAADPLNSRIAVRAMLALESAGDRAGALQHANVHAALVREELGAAPDPGVTELADELRMRPPAAAPGGPLPAPAAPVPPTDVVRAPGAQRARRVAFGAVAGAAVLVVAVIAALLATADGRSTAGPTATRGDVAAAAPFPAIRESIAVLPFVDLSPGRDQEHFSDGITEELITALSSVEWLKVAARTSVFRFKADRPDVREIAGLLNVAHVLEGAVRMDGSLLRITVQLVDAADGYQLWAESYDREPRDLLGVQTEIARSIVDALRQRLGSPPAGGAPAGAPTADPAAYEEYLKGLFFFNRFQIPRAIEAFTAATTMDPGFARAYSALAEAYAVPTAYADASPADYHARAIAAAETALGIDPGLADAHAALGWLQMIGLRWDDAGRSLRRAIELDPRAPGGRLYHALYLHRRGAPEAALAELEYARVIDPLALSVNAIYGSVLVDLGRVDEGLRALYAALELDPAHPIAHAVLAHALLGEGRGHEAISHYEAASNAVPNSYYAGFLGHAYARTGRISDARRVLGQLETSARGGAHVSPGAIGLILLALGEHDEAYRRLHEAARQRDVFLVVHGVLSNRPLSAPYAHDRRFQELRASMGMTP
jgi:TolB-like protein/DNA-binding SARP family transcriptional activator